MTYGLAVMHAPETADPATVAGLQSVDRLGGGQCSVIVSLALRSWATAGQA